MPGLHALATEVRALPRRHPDGELREARRELREAELAHADARRGYAETARQYELACKPPMNKFDEEAAREAALGDRRRAYEAAEKRRDAARIAYQEALGRWEDERYAVVLHRWRGFRDGLLRQAVAVADASSASCGMWRRPIHGYCIAAAEKLDIKVDSAEAVDPTDAARMIESCLMIADEIRRWSVPFLHPKRTLRVFSWGAPGGFIAGHDLAAAARCLRGEMGVV